jgi:hypothetical protein
MYQYKMRKGLLLIVGIFFLIMISNSLVSALCCEKLKNNGDWCQDAASANECNLTAGLTKWDFKFCDEVQECNMTCVNSKSGECSEQTPRAKCKADGGTPSYTPAGDISQCKEICCIIGQDAYFINPTACKAKGELFNIQVTMRLDITTREECEAFQTSTITGACVVSTNTERACKIRTNTECTSGNLNALAGDLKNPTSAENIDVRFWPDVLCTATLPNGASISDCIPTNNTVCKDYKVYFVDGCGNTANVYDTKMWNNKNYWTYIKKDYDLSVCNITNANTGSSTCGNCDVSNNTVCESWEDADVAQPSRISNPSGLVCGSMSCKVDMNGDGTKETTKLHGDSWCGDIKGAVNSGILIINKNLTTGQIFANNRTALKNASKYNLPGSRYYKLSCEFGEVLVEECKDYRNTVCIQGINDDSKGTQASCEYNPWRTCISIKTRTECEDNTSLCKWIPGYTWIPGQIFSESSRKEMQGSCAPIIAPGFDFWKATTQGNGICKMATVQESAMFEVHWGTNRESFADWSDKTHAARCLNGCYALPSYGIEFPFNGTKFYPEDIIKSGPASPYQLLTLFYEMYQVPIAGGIDSKHLSLRSGAYCHKKGKPAQWLTGRINYVTGSQKTQYDCTPGAGNKEKSLEKMRDYPVYLTNEEWIMSITDRLHSIGDCGYKMNTNGKYSAPETEIITAIFQKLTQKGAVKENITVEQIMWKGGAYIKGDLEPYETELGVATATQSYTCDPEKFEICETTVYNPNPCEGGTVNADATCPEKSVCCVYTELGA